MIHWEQKISDNENIRTESGQSNTGLFFGLYHLGKRDHVHERWCEQTVFSSGARIRWAGTVDTRRNKSDRMEGNMRKANRRQTGGGCQAGVRQVSGREESRNTMCAALRIDGKRKSPAMFDTACDRTEK